MIYRVLRWIAGIAVHWFYREIRIVDKEKIPAAGPLLIAANHQNALVDSLIVGWVVPRRITMTAKATLLNNPLTAALFKTVGVVPLRRTSDEAAYRGGAALDRSRNVSAFREVLCQLENGSAVLIFPEGKSHNGAGLEPLRTGLARLALQARDDQSIEGVRILPIGLIFQNKGMPGSIVGVRVGDPIEVDEWNSGNARALTKEIANRMRDVSESVGLPPASSSPFADRNHWAFNKFTALAAKWGRLTHELPISIARKLALRRSGEADQPAMLTMLFGIALVVLAYTLQIAVVGVLVRSFWITALYFTSLLVGAYWAAFENHYQRY